MTAPESELPQGLPNQRDHRHRYRAAAWLFTVMTVVVFLAINLPMEYVDRDGRWLRQLSDDTRSVSARIDRTTVQAGWPLHYSLGHRTDQVNRTRYLSWPKLMINVAIALLAAIGVYWFTRGRHLRIAASDNPRRTQLIFDAAVVMLALTTFAASLAATWRTHRHHQELARLIVKRGNCYTAIRLPAILADHVPGILRPYFARIRGVSLSNPSPEIVDSALAIPGLVGVELSGTTFPATALSALQHQHELSSLGIHRRDMTPEVFGDLGRLSQLTHVDFTGSNLDGDGLNALKDLAELERMTLLATDLDLRDIEDTPAWTKSLRTLTITRPLQGKPDRLRIRAWPSLERLVIEGRSTVDNPAECTLEVQDCPNLRHLHLDRRQKFAVHLVKLPRLVQFGQDISTQVMYMDSKLHLPGLNWLSRIEIQELANLVSLDAYVSDLREIILKDVPSLRHFTLGAFRVHGGGLTRQIEVDPKICQNILDDLGTTDGPAELMLDLFPAEGLDLSGLAKNPSIRAISASACGLDFDQVRDLAPMHQIESLRLGETSIGGDQFQWLTETFPDLKELELNLSRTESLVLEGNDDLVGFYPSAIRAPDKVCLRDVPRLSGWLTMTQAPRQLQIVNAPSLLGLTVDGPWPSDHEFRGVRNLRWFAAAGPEVDDAIFAQLRDCFALDELAIAYGQLTEESLRQIDQFRQLTGLYLPGARLDDTIVQEWHGVRRLQYLNLDDTGVDAGTIRWARDLRNLKHLSLNRISLSDDARRLLRQLDHIQELQLADTGASEDDLIPILAEGEIQRLQIDGMTIGKTLCEALVACDSLRELSIRRCLISPADLRHLVQHPSSPIIRLNPDHPSADSKMWAEIEAARQRDNEHQRESLSTIPVGSFSVASQLDEQDRRDLQDSHLATTRKGKISFDRLRLGLESDVQP